MIAILLLAAVLAISYGGWYVRGCSETVDANRAEIMAKQQDYEIRSKCWQTDAEKEITALRKQKEAELQRLYAAVRNRQIEEAESFQQEVSRLEKVIALRMNDREFKRIVGGKLLREHKEYQAIGQDLAHLRMRMEDAETTSRLYGQPLPPEWKALSVRLEQAQASLNEIGRDIQETVSLIKVEEDQYATAQ